MTVLHRLCVAGFLFALVSGSSHMAFAEPAGDAGTEKAKAPAVLDFTMNDIHGEPVNLARYHGRVVLMVNVASKCGLTRQYTALQKLHEEYAEKGLAILGFPANDFGKQEPGTDAEILEFCSTKFQVKFDMFSKIAVKGDEQAPLYKFLTEKETNGEYAGEISWNFEKFLISREGKVVARFKPRTRPDAKEVLDAIERELARPSPKAVASGA